MTNTQKQHKPFLFFGLSLIIPWVLWFITAYISHLPNADEYQVVQSGLMVLGLFVPTFLAIWLILRNPQLTKDIKHRLSCFFNIPLYYLLMALFLPVTALIIAQLISVLFGYSLDQFYISGNASFESALLSPWLMISMAAIVEELAWHSYGFDALTERFNVFISSMIFTVYWAFWHLPLAFIKGYYHSEVVAQGAIYTVNFVLSMVVFVLLINWLYIKGNRSILLAILFHLGANVGNEIFATHPISKVIQTGIFAIIVGVLLYKDRGLFFNKITTHQ